MTIIFTSSGVEFDVRNPSASDVRIEDIAHALARICRFGGHTAPHYSVAQHSVLVAQLVEEATHDTEHALAALLHDAAEAYVGDVPTPVKTMLGNIYEWIELGVLSAIARAFDVNAELFDAPCIKYADLVALATEKRDFLPAGGRPWRILDDVDPIRTYQLRAWPIEDACARFLGTFRRLEAARAFTKGAVA